MPQQTARSATPFAALACGVLGFAGAVITYWLVVPGLVLGVAAVGLGWRARRRGHVELGCIAMTLGVVSVLLVPAIISNVDAAEDWARDCALHPESDSNC